MFKTSLPKELNQGKRSFRTFKKFNLSSYRFITRLVINNRYY